MASAGNVATGARVPTLAAHQRFPYVKRLKIHFYLRRLVRLVDVFLVAHAKGAARIGPVRLLRIFALQGEHLGVGVLFEFVPLPSIEPFGALILVKHWR